MLTKPDNSSNQLFPARLTSIEKYHFFRDCYEFPNNLFCRLRFVGKVNRKKAIEALTFCEERHPLVNVAVRLDGNKLFWDGHHPPSETLRWDETSESPNFSRLDLTESSGIRFLFKETDDKFEVWIHAHYAAFDSAAVIQIANDWMLAYANLAAGRDIAHSMPRLDSQLLQKRHELGLDSPSRLKLWTKQPFAIWRTTRHMFRQFGLLTNAIFARSKPQILHDTFPVIHGEWMSAGVLKSLQDQAIKHKVSLNSILLSHLFLTVRDWRTDHQHGRPEDWIRIVMPTDIRATFDREMPAANRSSFVEFDRRHTDFRRPDLLAKGLNDELEKMDWWYLNRMFLIAVRGMSTLSSWLRSSAESQKYRGTIVFANLGNPFSLIRELKTKDGIVAGNLRLKDFDVVGPIRPGLGVNLFLQTHGKRMRLSMHVDTRQVDMNDAEELFEAFLERVDTVRI